MIETTTTYTTSDGRRYADLGSAQAHEAALSRADDVQTYVRTRRGAERTLTRDYDAVMGWLAWDARTVDEPAQDEAAE